MKSIAKMVWGVSVLFILNISATAQQTGYSDINISALSLTAVTKSKKVPVLSNNANTTNHPVAITPVATDTLKCSITLNNAGNTTAYGKLVVVLPAEVSVTYSSLPSNAKMVNERGVTPWPGYVEIDYILISANQSATFEFTFIKSTLTNKVSAFVFSTVPDANPLNNYKNVSY